MRRFAVIVLAVGFSGLSSAAGFASRPIQFSSDLWRPLSANEVCPQGHVEVFSDDAAGRHWTRPQLKGQDVPCGLGKRVGATWFALDQAEYCQEGFVGDVVAGRPGRAQVNGQDVPCGLVRMP